jgi:hypothetical protein
MTDCELRIADCGLIVDCLITEVGCLAKPSVNPQSATRDRQ